MQLELLMLYFKLHRKFYPEEYTVQQGKKL